MLRWAAFVVVVVIVKEADGSCATKEFMPCVVQLNTQRVPFDTNIMKVIYNISTEARLIHTCRAYERAFPCFIQRLNSCGTKDQKSVMDKGKRLHTYLCAPFSLQRQKIFLKYSQCIQSVLKQPVDSRCEKKNLMTKKLHSCRSKCEEDDLLERKNQCKTKVDISEVAACSYIKIENICGVEAAQFYAQMQQVVSNREYPVQCSYTLRGSTSSNTSASPPTTSSSTTVASIITTNSHQELKKKTTPYYFSTSYITVYPEGYVRHNGVSRKEAQPSRIRSRNFSKLFTAMKSPPSMSTLPGAPLLTSRLPNIPTTAFSFTIPTTTSPSTMVTSSTSNTIMSTAVLPGARPIPETAMYAPSELGPSVNNHFPAKIELSVGPGSAIEKFIPWYHNNKEAGSAPTNPMIAPFMDVPPYPTLLPSALSNDFPNGQTFTEEVTPAPFKININWMDGPEESVWYQQNMPQQRKVENEESSPFEMVTPLLNHLKSKQLNFTEMGNQASNYFNAALSALESVADESRAATVDNNPWRTIIDAVAPTLQKVNPYIIPRIRQEMERIESQGTN